ncbi:MAG: FAD-binding protein, partial [Pseudorhizobium sp.]
MTLTPHTENDAAYVIRNAAADRKTVSIIGNGTRNGFGNRIACDETLSSSALTGIVDYEPAEMVMTVRAGTPVAEIESALAANRQMMSFEPMDHRQVMGTAG